MNRGRSNKLVGQTGEYLVAAELSRRGLIATTFTGNVPHYDIVASDKEGHHVSVQVKTSTSSSWQFARITDYCQIEFDGHKQVIGAPTKCPVNRLVMTFVRIDDDRTKDSFFVLEWDVFRDIIVGRHREYLAKHDGVRPKRWDSLHVAISADDLVPYADAWDTVEKNLL